VAIVDHARQHGIDVGALHAGSLVADWPFDPAGKYLTHVWLHHPDGHRAAAKGSIEGIIDCTSPSPAIRAEIIAANTRFAAHGMRVIAVAGTSGVPPTGNRHDDETGLRFLGLVAFDDPIRDGVRDALAQCRNAGIRVVMITGDHPATAQAVAESLDLPHEADGRDVIATGDDLDGPDHRVDELARTANVYARTGPEQKHRLVQALRQQGHVVAMTGDGINDAPALRQADIGVAMGRRGTEVARDAASLVLLDDNFATIVAAVRDGRRIFDNLTRAFAYLIAFHPPLLLAALVIPLLDRPLLLLPIHLVVLELLLHPIVSLVFQADPADPDAMSRPPRSVGDSLRLRALWRPYAVGIVLAVAIIAEYLLALAAGWPITEARALGFATLLASQPPLLLTMRSPDRPLWRPSRPWTPTLIVATTVILTATLAVVYIPAIADLLQLTPFAPAAWGIVAAVATTATLWAEPLKSWRQVATGGL
jgi:Ca2+-transporting ATPase